MPADRIPTTPEQWAAITPNATDYALGRNWMVSREHPASGAVIAAASRIAEHERCVERLAAYLFDCEWHKQRNVNGGMPECVAEARRILEDR